MQRVKVSSLLILGLLLSSPFSVLATGRIALVIDDLGNQLAAGRTTIDLPFVSTVAIMPGRPYSASLAAYAHAAGLEVIVHLPMANLTDFPLGEYGLDTMDNFTEFRELVETAIATVPHSIGLSNHMGSRLTQDRQSMKWLMTVLKSANLYFFDSRTVHNTVAWQVANEQGVPWAMRNIFLDHEQSLAFIGKQWMLALDRAKSGEDVAVIGHPYPETIDFLQRQKNTELPANVQFVPLSHFLNYPSTSIKQPKTTDGFQFMLR